NELVRSGEVKAPVVIGRDHLDAGSVASPYRETEAMRDGSDAIADWPILNALVNVAAGATWVSVHHGGGVGIGNAIHAGMVVVADGTDAQADRLERVLTTDPGTGVMRHADAGYDDAIDAAREHGLDLPSLSEERDCRGLCAVPGLVDCHTHAAFGGDRVDEFSLRAAGASYEELHAAGGGILSTVRATRAAGDDGLREAVRRHRRWMLRAGTTAW